MASMEEYQQLSQTITKILFEEAMQGDWDSVVKRYKEDKTIAQRSQITRSGDTVLHLAIANEQTLYVKELLKLVDDGATLETKNGKGNNALHSASEMGNVEMCRSILQRQDQLENGRGKNLIIARNQNGETPIFLSVLRGNREAFQYLVENFQEVTSELCRRNDGDTILHCAISGEHFDLAFWILSYFPRLASAYNMRGYSPLHLLANHPSAFRSGMRLVRTDRLLYYSISIDLLNDRPTSCIDFEKGGTERPHNRKFPKNYKTCINVCELFCKIIYPCCE